MKESIYSAERDNERGIKKEEILPKRNSVPLRWAEAIKSKIRKITKGGNREREVLSRQEIKKEESKDLSSKYKTEIPSQRSVPLKRGAMATAGTDSPPANIAGATIGAGLGVASSLGLGSLFLSLAGSATKTTTVLGIKVAETATAGTTFWSGLSAIVGGPIGIIGLGILGGYLGYRYISKLFKR